VLLLLLVLASRSSLGAHRLADPGMMARLKAIVFSPGRAQNQRSGGGRRRTKVLSQATTYVLQYKSVYSWR